MQLASTPPPSYLVTDLQAPSALASVAPRACIEWRAKALENLAHSAHIVGMAKPIRLLEVNISFSAPTRWKWSVFEGPVEITCGYETTRETAQIAGNSALFALLSIDRQ